MTARDRSSNRNSDSASVAFPSGTSSTSIPIRKPRQPLKAPGRWAFDISMWRLGMGSDSPSVASVIFCITRSAKITCSRRRSGSFSRRQRTTNMRIFIRCQIRPMTSFLTIRRTVCAARSKTACSASASTAWTWLSCTTSRRISPSFRTAGKNSTKSPVKARFRRSPKCVTRASSALGASA